MLVVAERLRSEEHTPELQSLRHLVCHLLLEKKKYGGICRPTLAYVATGRPHPPEPLSARLYSCPTLCRWARLTLYQPGFRRLSFFNDTATTEIYALSLHDALPISLSNPLNNSSPRSATSNKALFSN